MDMRRLRYFVTIAEERQITRAANLLNMAQPPLSQQLKLLEDELGVVLFERSRRRMELTPAGQALYQRAKKLISDMDDIKQEVKEVGAGLRGSVAVGAVASCIPFLAPAMKKLQQAHPQITFRLFEDDTQQLNELLAERVIDLGIVRLPVLTDLPLSVLELTAEPLVLVAPKGWVQTQEINRLSDLSHLPFLLLHRSRGKGIYEQVMYACRREGFQPNVVCESQHVFTLLSLVNNKMGVAFVPTSSAQFFLTEAMEIFPVGNSCLRSQAGIIWLTNRRLSKIASLVIEQFQ